MVAAQATAGRVAPQEVGRVPGERSPSAAALIPTMSAGNPHLVAAGDVCPVWVVWVGAGGRDLTVFSVQLVVGTSCQHLA